MMKLESEKENKNCKLNQDYCLKLIGGLNLTNYKPIHTENNNVLIIIDNFINVYNVSNGLLIGKIGPKYENQENIVSVCLHPTLSDFHCFYFTKDGKVFQYNYLDFSFVKEFNFKLDDKILYEFVWATAKNYIYNGSENIVFYYSFQQKSINKSNEKYHIFAVNGNELDKPIKIHKMSVFNEQRVSFGRNQVYVLFIDEHQIYYLPLQNYVKFDLKNKIVVLKKRKHSSQNKRYNLITCNPLKDVFAFTGDDGKIVFCTLDLKKIELTNINFTHWHTHPIQDMCFSSSGTYLYSVGLETVIVRWNVENLQNNFLPRLGYAIKFISCDQMDKNLTVSLYNNKVRIVGSHYNSLQNDIDGLAFVDNNLFKGNLVYDRKKSLLVMNGRPGWLQFYSPFEQKIVLDLDVTETNYIGTSNSEIINIDVFKFALSPCGKWLSTFERAIEDKPSLETRLKFWEYENNKNNIKYTLNSCLSFPHIYTINDMKFSNKSNFMVTTSQDKSFKVWTLEDENWICSFTSFFYENLIPTYISFSEDSSIFSINYDTMITIWNAKDLKNIFYVDTLSITIDEINKIEQKWNKAYFGFGVVSHLITSFTNEHLVTWDLVNSKIKWNYKSESKIIDLCLNDSTNQIVLLNEKGNLLLFNINSEEGVPLISLDLDKKVTCNIKKLLFIKNTDFFYKVENDIFSNLMLCFLTNSNLLYLSVNKHSEKKIADDLLKSKILKLYKKNEESSNSLFINNLIERKIKTLNSSNNKNIQIDLKDVFKEQDTSKIVDEMFYFVPSHVLPPIQVIGKHFLKTLLSNLSNNVQQNDFKTNYNFSNEKESDMEVDKKIGNNNLSKLASENSSLKSNEICELFNTKHKDFVFNEDYSFLSNKV